MQKVCVYGLKDSGVLNSISIGLEASGKQAVWRRHDVFTSDCFESAFDMVVVNGLRKQYAKIHDMYSSHNIPVLVTDLGYIRRNPGYFQVGFNRLGWIPGFPCPKDRLDALEIEIKREKEGNSKIKNVVICGQRPMDAAHNLTEEELIAYYSQQLTAIRENIKDSHVTWRPHPNSQMKLTGVDAVDLSLDFADKLGNFDVIVAYNSTVGLAGITAGVPVICHPSAYYAEMCETDISNIKNVAIKSAREVEMFLARVAYGQWTVAEIESGAAFAFLFAVLDKRCPFAEDFDAEKEFPVEAPKKEQKKPQQKGRSNAKKDKGSNDVQSGGVSDIREELSEELPPELAE